MAVNSNKFYVSKVQPLIQEGIWLKELEDGYALYLIKFGVAYPLKMMDDMGTLNTDDDVEETIVDLAKLESGEIVPALAKTLESWENRNSLNVQDTFTEQVRTTAGDVSIDSSKGGILVSIVADSDFKADAFITSGFNRLHNAQTLGTSKWFVVPALSFGTFGTANQPNGILFTDSEGNNLKPTVKFKALTSGEPSSASEGVACTYVDSNGYRFYTCNEPGFMIVSGIDFDNTCAHIAWSRRYDDYIAPNDASDTGTTIDLSSILAAVHSDVKKLLVAGSVADRIDFNGTQATWTRKVGRVIPTWTNTQNEVSEGQTQTYTHTATISSMKSGGTAEIEGSTVQLSVNGTTISYIDENSTATTNAVKYELATIATGNIIMSNALTVEDWGLEYFTNQAGEAFVTTQYAQGYPDAVAALVNSMDQSTVPVIAAAFAKLDAEIKGLKAMLKGYGEDIEMNTVDSLEYKTYGKPMFLTCSTAGAPNSVRIPNEWDTNKYGYWTGVPYAPNMFYTDTSGKHVYYAPVCTNSAADWIQLC